MKIVHIIIGLSAGGAELMLKRLVLSHVDNPAYQHSVISLTTLDRVGEQMKELGVEVNALNMRSVLDVPRVFFQLYKCIRIRDPEIVQTWMYHADLLGGIAAKLSGNRFLIWGVRATEIASGSSRSTAIIRRICAYLSRWVPNTVICAAEASRKVHVTLGYYPAVMEVIPNGYDLNDFTATIEQREKLRKYCNINKKEIVVGSIGRFNSVKDHKNFVDAAGLLVKKYPDLRFLMVGRNVDSNNLKLNNWISETEAASRFVLLGERQDIAVCYSAIDIFCLHSKTEGFPNVLGEAMAMGLPCVTTDVGDAAFLLGDAGRVVPSENSVALANGILDLLADKYSLLGVKAKRRIFDHFTLSHTRECFEEVYKRALI